MVHFNWLELLPFVTHYGKNPGEVAAHVATAAAVGFILCLWGLYGRVALGKGEAAIEPAKSFSLKAFFETVTEFVIGLTEMVMGDKGIKFAPMFATVFFFILINNLVGLMPGMTPATEDMNTTLAIGLFSFGVYNYYGVKEHGSSYIKQFLGPVLWLAPLLFVIEMISHALRPFTLGLRLQANIMGDHMVVGTFYELVPYLVPVGVYFIGVFVSFMQAFVFTLLSIIYVAMAMAHDH